MSLHLVLSNQFGGKTSYQIRLMDLKGRISRVLYINSAIDDRASTPFSTHNKTLNDLSNLNADMFKFSSLGEIFDKVDLKGYQSVFIDEGQFFADLVDVVTKLVDVYNKDVYIAALNGDYKRRNFGHVHELLPMADSVTLLRDTPCKLCADRKVETKALFTHRLNDVSNKQVESGADNYIPVCRGCYLKLNQ